MFDDDEIIVSKTDLGGKIVYANDVFLRLADYTEQEVLGKPHNIIRHPDMPRCVFKLLWDTISSGHELFAYVVNRTKFGDHYWVLAHVTPTYGQDGGIVGYHSNRRVPNRKAVDTIAGLYAQLRAEEKRHASAKEALAASSNMLYALLDELGLSYRELIFALERDGVLPKPKVEGAA